MLRAPLAEEDRQIRALLALSCLLSDETLHPKHRESREAWLRSAIVWLRDNTDGRRIPG